MAGFSLRFGVVFDRAPGSRAGKGENDRPRRGELDQNEAS